MLRSLRRDVVGVSTMRHEHLGTTVVDRMVVGLVAVAYHKGGVEKDIVGDCFNVIMAGDAAEVAEVLKMADAETEDSCALDKKNCLCLGNIFQGHLWMCLADYRDAVGGGNVRFPVL